MQDGSTYSPKYDKCRLSSNTAKVLAVFLARRGIWLTKARIRDTAGLHPAAEVRARYADLKKAKWGSWPMESRRCRDGVWEYRMGPATDPTREAHLRNVARRVLGEPKAARRVNSDSPAREPASRLRQERLF